MKMEIDKNENHCAMCNRIKCCSCSMRLSTLRSTSNGYGERNLLYPRARVGFVSPPSMEWGKNKTPLGVWGKSIENAAKGGGGVMAMVCLLCAMVDEIFGAICCIPFAIIRNRYYVWMDIRTPMGGPEHSDFKCTQTPFAIDSAPTRSVFNLK